MIIDDEDYLSHYGTPRHSGRYPWGSGGDETTTRNKSFLDHVAELKAQGMNDSDIYKAFGMSSTEYRARVTMERASKKGSQISQALKLKDKGLSNVAAAQKMGIAESTYRTLIAEGAKDKNDQLTSIADMLKQQVDENKFIDVGSGVENHIGVSKERLAVALGMLKQQGYSVHEVKYPGTTTGFEINGKVLVPPGVTQKEAWLNRSKITQLKQVSSDNGRTFGRIDHPPMSIDPKRVGVKYKEEGGDKADGMIYVRQGVPDVSLGDSRYAQVRIKVGNDHYLKGMAMYKDNLPEGVDLLFNTNKSDTGNKLDSMKKLEPDPTLPFGSVIDHQITENTGTPQEKLTSVMNIVNREGQWKKWNRNISAQALSKQSTLLVREQLRKTFDSRQTQYDEIMALNNPAVRKKLLEGFADSTDKSAVHLKAAALERQNWHVILPIESMKPSEIYAPKYRNGERVALIRYPHGGTFEIPELTVNNRQPEARHLLQDAQDAVGIHHSVAERLSGADFDGDTVLVIPNDSGKIKTTPALEKLKGFDPMRLYKNPEGVEFSGNKQLLMGDVSNLITDMTLKRASHSEIADAVRHSMVVIDAEKKNLNYKQSAIDHRIRALKERYQGGPNAGADTLISLAKSEKRVPHRKPRPYRDGGPINRETGQLEFVPTGKKRRGPNGQEIDRMEKSTKLAETQDAHTLSSGTIVEREYADHSNKLKALANQARLSMINTPTPKRSASAAKAYATEVSSLKSQLALAKRNSPRERQANIIANQAVAARKAANPDLKGDTLNKVKYQELTKARDRVGAQKTLITITDNEWNAIQAGAISNHMLNQILDNADLEVVTKKATPRPDRMMTRAKTAQAQQLLDNGYTRAEVASRLGVSVSTLDFATSGDAEPGDD